ncbi:sensor histidine kinase [Vibrio coralliilyticus]|uniref:sensor histidine kinase n=1 Tax=Vibrio coralliilyticus TaxID=190893 RepID=UPI001830C762|nr:HAMP domain-containing sensor histidine kinase [Vibrio coralliilyticus]NUW70748.1 HAMP domain-containing histidine kinase [Vibrio coralliilyticus]
MSSSHNIEQALTKARNTLLLRFMAILLLCLVLVEIVVGVMFFFDLYRTEKKILNSMATEYQRILTYDSADQLIHVMTANPHRLIENNIAAFSISKQSAVSPNFVAGDSNLPSNIPLNDYTTEDKSWFSAFIINPYMSLKIKGETLDFWLVLDNQPRYAIAYKQWLMTLYALIVLVAITTLFTHRIIRSAMSPLVTLGDSLDKLSQGKLEMTDKPAATPQGLSVISASVHDAIARLHHVTTTLNTTVDAIAHDIRTPLSRITLSSQSALLDSKDTQQMEHALSDCAEYAMQASNMLTALMKLNDEVTGKRQQQSTSTNVSEVLKTVVSWYEDVADDKQIQLQVMADDNLIIQSDPEKLTQALVNLVDNAIKYTETGGKVSLKADTTSDHHVQILVSDTGIGIDKQYQDLIFERLYRVDASRSNIEGYGLGLSLAAAMVDNLGGNIQLVSAPNQGSTFTITLETGAANS